MTKFLAVGIALGFVALFSFILSYPVYLLWNGCLVDAVTIVKPVTWLQAWGISVLFALLVKSSDAKVELK